MFLYKKMLKEKKRVLREIEQVKHQLAVLPKWTFHCTMCISKES